MATSGLLTEREWRKQTEKARKARASYCGAQCVIKKKQNALLKDRAFHAFMIFLAFVIAVLMPIFVPRAERIKYNEVALQETQEVKTVRAVSAISYALPSELEVHSVTYTRQQLLLGKLMLVDQSHPLPTDAPAPNTFNIASYGKGMVPVGGLGIKSGRETIDALLQLFASMRARGITALAVWQGSLSAGQLKEIQHSQLTQFAAQMPLNDAVAQTLAQTDAPMCGEIMQEYTVEIRLGVAGSELPDARALMQSEEGRYLLKNAWRYGFVQRSPNATGTKKYRFRYVGVAHATAMAFLDVTFEEYLAHLHEKREVIIRNDGKIEYIILCEPIYSDRVQFTLPTAATYEFSLDNTGYAVVACTLKE